MGNQLEKQYNIKEKPLKLPGSYNFLKFIHHPTEDLSLIIVKHPHRATVISSNVVLPIKEIKMLSQSVGSVAVCKKCLPLVLVKPRSETEMKILMHKILRSSVQIGRCFFYMGRVSLWCEQKRGIACMSPEQVQFGKSHQKSKVFVSGMALINFLYCVYENEIAVKNQEKKSKKDSLKSGFNETKQKIKQKLKEKEKINESLPLQIKLFFEPKDKKQYYESYYTIKNRLQKATFWKNISEGLRQLLLNMIEEDPQKRIELESIVNIPYFMDSNQLRLYSTLADQLDLMSLKEAKIFMAALQVVIKQGLSIEACVMENFFVPVLNSMITYNWKEGGQTDYLVGLALSILIELPCPPLQVIGLGIRKAHAKNWSVVRLVLYKRTRLLQLLSSDVFDNIISRALFNSFESQQLIESAIAAIPFAMRHIKQANYKKEIEYLLINRILMGKCTQSLLLDGLKCMIYLVRQKLITSPYKLEGIVYEPLKLTIEINFHILYLYGLLIECFEARQLLELMMPKLYPFLNDGDLYDQIFVVAKRCVDRILQKLFEQRKLNIAEMVELEKDENYFEMREDRMKQVDLQTSKLILKKEIEKNEIERLKWTMGMF